MTIYRFHMKIRVASHDPKPRPTSGLHTFFFSVFSAALPVGWSCSDPSRGCVDSLTMLEQRIAVSKYHRYLPRSSNSLYSLSTTMESTETRMDSKWPIFHFGSATSNLSLCAKFESPSGESQKSLDVHRSQQVKKQTPI